MLRVTEANFPKYEELLERAYRLLPERRAGTGERFTMPKFEVSVTGRKTFILNFSQVCDFLNRDPRLLNRYILKEIALPGSVEGHTAVIQGEVRPQLLNKLLERFVREYVICPVCGSPDTQLQKGQRGVFLMRCMACGAVTPVKSF
ncbi:MAG: translation initiation factor IF-2 subunit beta [Thermofilum sp.]|uniref:Translation initiation factor 2 subunit beta n=1 Tax=Thermofilum pendens TaxID=2269 RepID=A0A7C4H8R1_THEPE